jgi:hypothetical protein
MQLDIWVPLNKAAEINGRSENDFLERVKLGKTSSKRGLHGLGRTVYWDAEAERDKLGGGSVAR